MNVKDAAYTRRAVKHFDPAHRIPEAEVRTLIETTMQSPTSFNIQHWRFVVISDPELRKQIRALAFDQAHLTDASVLVLFTGDKSAWRKDPARYWRNAPKPVLDFMVGMIGPFHDGREQLQHDEAMRSIGIAMQTMMLAATEMGYQTCPTIGFDHAAVAKLVRLPADHIIGPFVAIGKGIKDAWPKPGPLAFDEVVIRDRFPA
jgi:nitroreductase